MGNPKNLYFALKRNFDKCLSCKILPSVIVFKNTVYEQKKLLKL